MKHPIFPKVGELLKFTGVPDFIYPQFSHYRRASRDLVVGQVYKCTRVDIYSSYCAVWVEVNGKQIDEFLTSVCFKRNDTQVTMFDETESTPELLKGWWE